jgi:hypothetical protein
MGGMEIPETRYAQRGSDRFRGLGVARPDGVPGERRLSAVEAETR